MTVSGPFRLRRTLGYLLMIAWAGFLTSCANTSGDLPANQREIAATADLINRARADISYLDGAETEGRSTASRGFTRAATYLAAQLRANGLQPVLEGEYRLQYAARIVRPRTVDITWVTRDSTRAAQGRDYLITGIPETETRTDTESLLPDLDGIRWNDDVDMDAIRWWQVDIDIDDQVSSAPMHVIGMIPGADPMHRDSVVVWIAPIDGSGLQGSQSWTDGSDLAIPAAGLMTAARRAATLQRTWSAFPQTIIVALVSGEREQCQGADMLVRHFPWDRTLISSITVVSMEDSTPCLGADLWSTYEDDLPPAGISELNARTPFDTASEHGFGDWRPRSETQRSQALDVATSEALRLARELIDRLP